MQMREWWIRHFNSEASANVASESDEFERHLTVVAKAAFTEKQ